MMLIYLPEWVVFATAQYLGLEESQLLYYLSLR